MADQDVRFDEMRSAKAPTPADTAELASYVDSLIGGEHTYNTCVPAMSLAAVAAYNLVASKLGVSGFQASCADLDILRQTRGLESGIVLNFENALYPQYNLPEQLADSLADSREWLAEKATALLATKDENAEYPAHPDVIAHWRKLARAA